MTKLGAMLEINPPRSCTEGYTFARLAGQGIAKLVGFFFIEQGKFQLSLQIKAIDQSM